MEKQTQKNHSKNNGNRGQKKHGDKNHAMENALAKAGFKNNFIKNNLPPSPMVWKEDGVDHHNLNVGSKILLSRAMTLEHASVITHPAFGRFQSIVGMQGYITAKVPDEKFRTLRGIELSNAIRQNATKFGRHHNTPNLNAILAQAAYDKVAKSENLTTLLKESVLPFDSWYVNRGDEYGVRNRAKSAFWYVPVVEEIRLALREAREPKFDFLMDRVNPMSLTESYKFILERMREGNEKLKPAPLAKIETPAPEAVQVVKKGAKVEVAEGQLKEEKPEEGNTVDNSVTATAALDPADTGAAVLMEQFKKTEVQETDASASADTRESVQPVGEIETSAETPEVAPAETAAASGVAPEALTPVVDALVAVEEDGTATAV